MKNMLFLFFVVPFGTALYAVKLMVIWNLYSSLLPIDPLTQITFVFLDMVLPF